MSIPVHCQLVSTERQGRRLKGRSRVLLRIDWVSRSMASGSDDGWRGELSGCVDAGGEGGFCGRRGRGNITLEGFRWMRGGVVGGFWTVGWYLM